MRRPALRKRRWAHATYSRVGDALTKLPAIHNTRPLLLFRLLKKLNQVILPDRSLRMRSVSARRIRDVNENELRMRHLRHQPLRDAKLRRIDKVIGGVDPQHWRGDCA